MDKYDEANSQFKLLPFGDGSNTADIQMKFRAFIVAVERMYLPEC